MDSDLRQLYEKDKQSKTIAITSTVIILLLLITVIILLTLLSPMNVVGESMLPSIKDGEHVLLLKRCYRIERYDVIVFKRPADKARDRHGGRKYPLFRQYVVYRRRAVAGRLHERISV